LTDNGHVRFNAKDVTPSLTVSTTPNVTSKALFTSEKSNVDYFTLYGVCKRTGATENELVVFALKEKTDNALDFSEINFPFSSLNGNPEIFVDVKYEKELNRIIIKVENSNFGLKDIGFTEERIHAIFDDPDRFHSSKRNLFKIYRGSQGDASKEIVGIHKVLGEKYDGKEQGGWNEPLTIRNGEGDEFEIRGVVDKIAGRNYFAIVKKTAANDNFTEVETHLPYNDNIVDLGHIKLALIKYALLNTHITFHFNIVTSITHDKYWKVTLPATQKMIIGNTNAKRLTSIYWTDLSIFENLIYGIDDKNLILYNVIVNHFKEGSSLRKEDDLLVPIGQLQRLPREEGEEKICDIFLRLRATMGPPTDPSILKRDLLPFSIKDRERALFARADQLGFDPKHIKYKAKVGYFYSDHDAKNLDISKSTTDTCIPYIIETAAIHTYKLPYYLLYCEGINAASNHYHSFTDGYSLEWTTKSGTKKVAYSASGLLRECGYSFSGNGKQEKERSIVFANLWCPKIQYTDYGKSDIDLNPFYDDLIELLSKMCSGGNKRRDDQGNKLEAKALFAEYLVEERYKKVLKESHIKNTDSWNTSTPVYRYRPELERRGIHVERKYLQGLVKTICDEMPELRLLPDGTYTKTGKIGVRRDALGIYEAARAYIYFRGTTYDVSFKQLEKLKKIATFILIIEKEGVVELLTYWADKYGFAICYTKGFLTDNATRLSRLAANEGAKLAILTDDDFAGWAMAREVPNVTRIGIKIETLQTLKVPIGEVAEDQPRPKNSKNKNDVDYHNVKHATTTEQMYDGGLIPEDDWELLIGGKYGRRVEIDNVIAYTGAERFWKEFILPSFEELSDEVDYNLSLKKIVYVTLPNLDITNKLMERRGTQTAADEVNGIESEYASCNIFMSGFIDDIDAVEEENSERIKNKELEDEHIRWYEQHLGLLNEEFSRRTGITITEKKQKEQQAENNDLVNGTTSDEIVDSDEDSSESDYEDSNDVDETEEDEEGGDDNA